MNPIRESIRKIPEYGGEKSRLKRTVASVIYGLLILVLLAIVIPTAPTLALDKVGPTNKSLVSIAGKTFSDKPVYLLKDNKVIQSTKADSSGKFYFALNDLKEGNFTYTVEVCDSEEKKRCKNENILIVVDQTPPPKPTIVFPNKLPDDSEEQVVIKGITEPDARVIASIQDNKLPPTTANDKGEFEIKTGLVLGTNTINVKAVDAAGNESAVSGVSLDFNPSRYKAKVARIIDGDTIKLESGEVVRYIGMDTPETVHPSKPVQCYGKEASAKNRELVEGKEVRLEKDVSETDKYGRLLRYIWLGDTLVNEYLVREGYARSSTYPPDVKYQNRFIEAERQARQEGKGLWGDTCNTSTPTPTTPPSSPTTPSSPPVIDDKCDCSKTCPQISSCEEAQYQLNVCGCARRDADKDGVACDAQCQ